MRRTSSMLVASTLAILPISAFAQQAVAPANTAASTSMTTTAPATDKTVAGTTAAEKTDPTKVGVAGKAAPNTAPANAAAKVTQPAKPDVKTTGHGAKTEVHGMNTVSPHASKTGVPAKTAEPAKS